MLTQPRIGRVIRLSTLGVRAWCGLLAFDTARLAGFARLHRWLKRCRVNAINPGSLCGERDVIWAVEEACVWYFKRAACLQRSVVATWLLRRRGFHASLVIGYRPIPFESHAWVEIDGRVVNDLPQYQTAFTILERL
jgi:hypothetical protein